MSPRTVRKSDSSEERIERDVATTAYPASRNPATRPAPMPCEAPVMTATFCEPAAARIYDEPDPPRGVARWLLDSAAVRLPVPLLFHPWNGERSPASQAARSPGVLRSQSGRISRVTARRSCQRSTTEGRPQNQ